MGAFHLNIYSSKTINNRRSFSIYSLVKNIIIIINNNIPSEIALSRVRRMYIVQILPLLCGDKEVVYERSLAHGHQSNLKKEGNIESNIAEMEDESERNFLINQLCDNGEILETSSFNYNTQKELAYKRQVGSFNSTKISQTFGLISIHIAFRGSWPQP